MKTLGLEYLQFCFLTKLVKTEMEILAFHAIAIEQIEV